MYKKKCGIAYYISIPNFRILGLITKNFKTFITLYSIFIVSVTVRVYSNVVVNIAYSNAIVSLCINISNVILYRSVIILHARTACKSLRPFSSFWI